MNKYESLARLLTEQISHNLKKGISRLPTEAELCRQHHVSRQTVRSALALLHAQGIIASRQGSGSYATGLSDDAGRNIIPILIYSQQEYLYPSLLSDILTEPVPNGSICSPCLTIHPVLWLSRAAGAPCPIPILIFMPNYGKGIPPCFFSTVSMPLCPMLYVLRMITIMEDICWRSI